MPLQWLKKNPKGSSETRKEKFKVNDKIQKLISDIKSKRESMASVQTGFPSSVASFVTNTWMPSHDDDNIPAKKKKRWPYTKKKAAQSKESSQSAKAESPPPDEVRGPPTDPQSMERLYKGASTETQSLRHFSTGPQSEDEISEQICSDHEGVVEVGRDPQFVGQIRNDRHGQFGCEPHDPLCRGYEPQSVGLFGKDPESVGVTLDENSKDQSGKDVSSLGQLCTSEGPPRFCPLCGELLAVVVILAVSVSVVLDAKKAALGLTAIVYVVLRVLFRKQETLSRTNIVSISSSICKEVRNICQNICFLESKNRIRSRAPIRSEFPSLRDKVGVLPSFAEGVQCDRSKFGINREVKKRKTLVKKSGLGMKPSSALGSSLLIVVLMGLTAGRLPAFVLVLAWCLLVKLVQTAEERTEINAFSKVKK